MPTWLYSIALAARCLDPLLRSFDAESIDPRRKADEDTCRDDATRVGCEEGALLMERRDAMFPRDDANAMLQISLC